MAFFAAMALCAAVYTLLAALVDRGLPLNAVLLFSSAATLVLAAVAVVFGYMAVRRTSHFKVELRRQAVSIDAVLEEVSRPKSRVDAADAPRRATSGIAASVLPKQSTPEPGSRTAVAELAGDNIVPHPATQRPRIEAVGTEPQAASRTLEAQAVQRAVNLGQIEISLEPIISIARGAAAGFEVFAHLELADGTSIDVRRAGDLVRPRDQAAFERLLVTAAAEAARRELGNSGTAMPLHVAVSENLLAAESELALVFELFKQYPVLAKSLVLSLPDRIAANTVERLSDAGIQLAVEGISPKAVSPALAAATYVKLPAGSILGHSDPNGLVLTDDLRSLAGKPAFIFIATEVKSDEEAVALIDLGITLMSGPRFSGPKRLKPSENERERPTTFRGEFG